MTTKPEATAWSYHSSSELTSQFAHRRRRNVGNGREDQRRRPCKSRINQDGLKENREVGAKETTRGNRRTDANEEGGGFLDGASDGFRFAFDVVPATKNRSDKEFAFGFDAPATPAISPASIAPTPQPTSGGKKARKKKKKKKKKCANSGVDGEQGQHKSKPAGLDNATGTSLDAKVDRDAVDSRRSSLEGGAIDGSRALPADPKSASDESVAPSANLPQHPKAPAFQTDTASAKGASSKGDANPAAFQFDPAVRHRGAVVNNRRAGADGRRRNRSLHGPVEGRLHTREKDTNPFTFGFSGILPPTPTSGDRIA